MFVLLSAKALADTGQVFLPINNALSPVGHVHWFVDSIFKSGPFDVVLGWLINQT